jgi:ribosomal protein S18 acetylase RimI-like enzyme
VAQFECRARLVSGVALKSSGSHCKILGMPSRDWTIRDVSSQEDWDRAMALLVAVYVGEGFAQPGFAQQTFSRNRLESEGDLVVAVALDGTILGAVLLLNDQTELRQIAEPGEAEFRLLAVNDIARGGSVGRELVQECLSRAKVRGARTMVLCTQPSMCAAQTLYERLGFTRRVERDFQMASSGPRWVYSVEIDSTGKSTDLHDTRSAQDGMTHG